jgi:hypothetical protein
VSQGTADSRWYRKASAEFLAVHTICWICGHGGANSIDHALPVSLFPWLKFEPSNWRPSHGGGRRCPTCGLDCNAKRGNSMTMPKITRSRAW